MKSLKEVDGTIHNLNVKAEKVSYDQENESKKKLGALEDIIKNLKEFKIEKSLEEKKV